ncbi:MAG: hypothetical protein JSS37_00050 [Proteobacteria bacterium]|nr:hypothetical protein [Pseudomonadota bacterium]
MNHNSLLLPCSPDLSRFDGHKLCPIREGDASAHCWGARCAAFRPINSTVGICALIERVKGGY